MIDTTKFHLGDIVYPAIFDCDFFISNKDIENMKHIYGVITNYMDNESGEREYSIQWCDFSTHDKTENYCPKIAWWYTNELTRKQEDFLKLLEKNLVDEEETEPLTEEELEFLRVLRLRLFD